MVVCRHLDFDGDVSWVERANRDDDADKCPTPIREAEADPHWWRRLRFRTTMVVGTHRDSRPARTEGSDRWKIMPQLQHAGLGRVFRRLRLGRNEPRWVLARTAYDCSGRRERQARGRVVTRAQLTPHTAVPFAGWARERASCQRWPSALRCGKLGLRARGMGGEPPSGSDPWRRLCVFGLFRALNAVC